MIEYDANRELCDGGPRFDATTIAQHCHQSTEDNSNNVDVDDATTTTITIIESTKASDDVDNASNNVDATLAKRTLKLELGQLQGVEKGSLDNEDDEKAASAPEMFSPVSNLSKYKVYE